MSSKAKRRAIWCPHCEDFHVYKGKLVCPVTNREIKGFEPVSIGKDEAEEIQARDEARK